MGAKAQKADRVEAKYKKKANSHKKKELKDEKKAAAAAKKADTDGDKKTEASSKDDKKATAHVEKLLAGLHVPLDNTLKAALVGANRPRGVKPTQISATHATLLADETSSTEQKNIARKKAAIAKVLAAAAQSMNVAEQARVQPFDTPAALAPEGSLYDPSLMPFGGIDIDDGLAEAATVSAGVGISSGLYVVIGDLWRGSLPTDKRVLPATAKLSCGACKMVLQHGCDKHGKFPVCVSDAGVRKVLSSCTRKGMVTAGVEKKVTDSFSCPDNADNKASREELLAAWHRLYGHE